ncbi:DUF5658 family protein [Paraburkholderia caledonica]
MRTDHLNTIFRNRTPILLGVVAVLQLLDWHSTLTAPHGRHESNKLLNWISQWIGFAYELTLIKAAFLLLLTLGFLYWRQHKGMYELEYGLCLAVLIIVYGCVVLNNYFS